MLIGVCCAAGDLSEGVRGGSVRRLGEHEPSAVRRQEHPLRDQVWSRSEGKHQTLRLKSTDSQLSLEAPVMN